MVNKTAITVIGVVILFVGLLAAMLFSSGLLSVTETGVKIVDDYIQVAELDNEFSGYHLESQDTVGSEWWNSCAHWQVYNSTYWSWETHSCTVCDIRGGDNSISFVDTNEHGSWSANNFKCENVKYNYDFKGKNLKFEYSYRPSPSYSGSGVYGTFKVSLGGQTLLDINKLQECTLELRQQTLNENMYNLYDCGNFVKDVDLTNSNGQLLINVDTAQPSIKNIRIQYPYGCEIKDDEVLVFDDFVSGSITIDKLTYEPTKFCRNNPVIIRSFINNGLKQDTDAEILANIRDNIAITVPEGQVYRIPYITKSQIGLPKCKFTQATNAQTGECQEVLTTEGNEFVYINGTLISNVQISCTTDTSCPVPSYCLDYNPTCKDNICSYPSDQCKRKEVSEGVSIVTIELGSNEFSYTQNYQTKPLMIGNMQFYPEKPEYICKKEINFDGYVEPGKPRSECWEVKTSKGNFIDGQTININDVLIATYNVGGRGVYFGDKKGTNYNGDFVSNSDWSNTFKFKVSDDALKITNVELSEEVMHNSTNYITITIKNNLANFDTQHSGVRFRFTTQLLDQVFVSTYEIPFSLGTNTYKVPEKTNSLGKVNVEITPYVIIESNTPKVIYSDNRGYATYKVIAGTPSTDKTTGSIETVKEGFQSTSTIIFAIVIFIALVVIVVIVYNKVK